MNEKIREKDTYNFVSVHYEMLLTKDIIKLCSGKQRIMVHSFNWSFN